MTSKESIKKNVENAKITWGDFHIRCPHCNKIGAIDNLELLFKKIVYFVGKEHKSFEVANADCFCENCDGLSRISNGVTIKRGRRLFEIGSSTLIMTTLILFILGMACLIVPTIVYGDEVAKKYNFISVVILMSTTMSSCLLGGLTMLYPNIKIHKTNKEKCDHYIPSVYEKPLLTVSPSYN